VPILRFSVLGFQTLAPPCYLRIMAREVSIRVLPGRPAGPSITPKSPSLTHFHLGPAGLGWARLPFPQFCRSMGWWEEKRPAPRLADLGAFRNCCETFSDYFAVVLRANKTRITAR
jgi:hypothetical protein